MNNVKMCLESFAKTVAVNRQTRHFWCACAFFSAHDALGVPHVERTMIIFKLDI